MEVEVYTGQLSPWAAAPHGYRGGAGWKESLQPGYGYAHGYEIFL